MFPSEVYALGSCLVGLMVVPAAMRVRSIMHQYCFYIIQVSCQKCLCKTCDVISVTGVVCRIAPTGLWNVDSGTCWVQLPDGMAFPHCWQLKTEFVWSWLGSCLLCSFFFVCLCVVVYLTQMFCNRDIMMKHLVAVSVALFFPFCSVKVTQSEGLLVVTLHTRSENWG